MVAGIIDLEDLSQSKKLEREIAKRVLCVIVSSGIRLQQYCKTNPLVAYAAFDGPI